MTALEQQGAAARKASRVLALAGTEKKNEALEAIAKAIEARQEEILAANAADFCYLVKFLFDLDPPIHIVTEEEKYRINTITNDEDQREALYGMANKSVSMTQGEYANWLEQLLLRMESNDNQ